MIFCTILFTKVLNKWRKIIKVNTSMSEQLLFVKYIIQNVIHSSFHAVILYNSLDYRKLATFKNKKSFYVFETLWRADFQ